MSKIDAQVLVDMNLRQIKNLAPATIGSDAVRLDQIVPGTGILKGNGIGSPITIAVVNIDYAHPNAYYVVTRATNMPPNSTNLGALTTGILKVTVTDGVAVLSIAVAGDFPSTPGSISLTAGSVVFSGGGSVLSEDNTNFRWDDVNNRLIINKGSAYTPDPGPNITVFGGVSVNSILLHPTIEDCLIQRSGNAVAAVISNGLSITQNSPNTNITAKLFSATATSSTLLTASTEYNQVDFTLGTVQWATGNFATQRSFIIRHPTYSFVGLSTISNAATLTITNEPQAGTNATLTKAYAIWVQGGRVRLDGLPGSGVVKNVDGTGLTIADINVDFASPNAFYVVTRNTNMPPNSANLGALTTGLVKITVASGIATITTVPEPSIGGGETLAATYALGTNATHSIINMDNNSRGPLKIQATSPFSVVTGVQVLNTGMLVRMRDYSGFNPSRFSWESINATSDVNPTITTWFVELDGSTSGPCRWKLRNNIVRGATIADWTLLQHNALTDEHTQFGSHNLTIGPDIINIAWKQPTLAPTIQTIVSIKASDQFSIAHPSDGLNPPGFVYSGDLSGLAGGNYLQLFSGTTFSPSHRVISMGGRTSHITISPGQNPSNNGGYLYAMNGGLYWIGATGTVRTIALP